MICKLAYTTVIRAARKLRYHDHREYRDFADFYGDFLAAQNVLQKIAKHYFVKLQHFVRTVVLYGSGIGARGSPEPWIRHCVLLPLICIKGIIRNPIIDLPA